VKKASALKWRRSEANLIRAATRAFAGRNEMKRSYAGRAVAAVIALAGWTLLGQANAAPPTVTPSPGYDARLQEQRAAASKVYEPAAPAPKPVTKRRVKRTTTY
jgi:hypothetical protein